MIVTSSCQRPANLDVTPKSRQLTLDEYGVPLPYMKVGILEKKYTDSEDMHTHLDFLTMENQKLNKKAFDDH